jgi:hypothetical protein
MRTGAPENQRRELYRIVYPIGARPSLEVDGRSHPVVDLCERGVRFLHPKAEELSLGWRLQGLLHFGDGTTMEVEGEVMRVEFNQAVLHLGTPISPARILKEQRYLLSRFPRYE